AASAAFLNGLTFPVQLLVRVVPCDLDGYLRWLERRAGGAGGAGQPAPPAAHHVALPPPPPGGEPPPARPGHRVAPPPAGPDRPGQATGPGRPLLARALEALRSLLPGAAARAAVARDDHGAAAARAQLAERCEEAVRQLARCGLRARRLDGASLAALFYAC